MVQIENFLAHLIETLFIWHDRAACRGCGGSGFALRGPYNGQGLYDMVCDECGGQSVYAVSVIESLRAGEPVFASAVLAKKEVL